MCTRKGTSLTLVALLPLAAACHGHKVTHVAPPPSLPVVVPEVEVNDFEWTPQNLGYVHGGEQALIEGAITDQGWDPRDGFRFIAQEPLVVDIELDAHVPGVDLDWCIWDPFLGAYVECAETEFNPEIGGFLVPAGTEFHVVVSSYFGTSTYSMWIGFSTWFGATLDATQEVERLPLETLRSDPERGYGQAQVAPATMTHVLQFVPLEPAEEDTPSEPAPAALAKAIDETR